MNEQQTQEHEGLIGSDTEKTEIKIDKSSSLDPSMNQTIANNIFSTNRKNSLPDITTLDIKMSKTNPVSRSNNESLKSPNGKENNSLRNESKCAFKEIDFFQDMEPVIITSNKHTISDILSSSTMCKSISKFEINDQDSVMNEVEGWGDEDDDVNWTVDNANGVDVNIGSDISVKNET